MIPTKLVRTQIGNLLAADTTTLAPATSANKIALINAPFTPSDGLLIGAVSFATTLGLQPIAGAVGAQGVGTDPNTQQQIVTILPPAGGYRFVVTTAPTVPETIYGFALTDNHGATLLATALLPRPVTVQNVGDQIDVDDPTLSILLAPIS